MILKDLETIERKETEVQRKAKSGDKKAALEVLFYKKVRRHLLGGRLVRYVAVATDDDRCWLHNLHLLTNKPVMYVCNVQESDLRGENEHVNAVRAVAAREGANVVVVSAAVEAEVVDLPLEDRTTVLSDLGMEESGLNNVVRAGYDLLHLLTFFTAGPKEVHAWTVPNGTPAPAAAGVIHSDFARGFIRAEVMRFEDLARYGSEQAVQDHGLLRIEGKEYLMQDRDVVFFRFNV